MLKSLMEEMQEQAGIEEARGGFSAVRAALGSATVYMKDPKNLPALLDKVYKRVMQHKGDFSPATKRAADDVLTQVELAKKHADLAWKALRKIQGEV